MALRCLPTSMLLSVMQVFAFVFTLYFVRNAKYRSKRVELSLLTRTSDGPLLVIRSTTRFDVLRYMEHAVLRGVDYTAPSALYGHQTS